MGKKLEFREYLKNCTNLMTSKIGVCGDFAIAFEKICHLLNIKCSSTFGTIMSGDRPAGHTWNILLLNGKLRHIDISSAIHNKDEGKEPSEYFLLTTRSLLEKDKDKNRIISENGKKQINELLGNASSLTE